MANSKIPNITLADTLNTQRLRINQLLDSVGDVSALTTAAGPVTDAINELDAELGTITSGAMGTTASTVSGAINELDGRLDSINNTELLSPRMDLTDAAATNTIAGKLEVGDSADFADNVSVDGNLDVQGITTLDSATVDGNLDITGNLAVNGNTTMSGTLIVDGEVTFKAGANSNINLGDSDGDNVVFNADVNSSITPNTDDTYDLGSSTKEWRHGYFDGTVNADNVAADSATLGTVKVSDLTDNRIVIVGTGGELEDAATLTFDGTTFEVGTKFDVDVTTGNTNIDGNLDVDGTTDLDATNVDGDLDVTGLFTTITTDGLTEGNNLYYTTARADSDAKNAVSGTDAGGDGSFAYNNATGVFTYTGPSATEVRNHISAGEGIDFSVGGVISGEDADSDNKGIASFSTDNFLVSAGAVSIKDNGITLGTETTGNYVATITGTANEVEVSGSGSETAGVTIGLPDDVTIGNNLTVTNNFTVNGSFTVAGEQRTAAQYIFLQDGATGTPALNAGITVDRGNQDSAVFQWNETGDYWEAGTKNDLNRLALQGDSAQFLRVDGTTGSFDNVDVSVDLNVDGITTLDSTTVGGNLEVNGITTLDSTTVDGNLEVIGNLTVSGTTTTTNTETVTINDNIIVLNDNAIGVPAAGQDAGIEIERGSYTNVQLLWDESAKYWVAATDSANTLSRIATANWIDATSPISYSSSTGNISHGTSGVSAGTYGSVTVDAKGHVTGGTNPTFDNYVSWTAKDSNGDTYTITSGDTLTIKGDDDHITSDWEADDVLKISHKNVTRTNTTTTSAPAYGGTFTAIDTLTTNAEGHVTGVQTKTITIPASDNTNTTYSAATSTTLGLSKIGSDTQVTGTEQDVTTTASRFYKVQHNASDQLVVNVPWVDTNTNTTYSAGNDLDLSSTTFNIEPTLNHVTAITTATNTNFTLTTSGTGDIYLDPDGLNVFMRGGGSAGSQLEFQLNVNEQAIAASDALIFKTDNSNGFIFQPYTVGNIANNVSVNIRNTDTVPVDGQVFGYLKFQAENSVSQFRDYAFIEAKAVDVSSGTEDGSIALYTYDGGTAKQVFAAGGGLDTSLRSPTNDFIFRNSSSGNSASGGYSPSLKIQSMDTVTQDNDILGQLQFVGYNSASSLHHWAAVGGGIVDNTNSIETGFIKLSVAQWGEADLLSLSASDRGFIAFEAEGTNSSLPITTSVRSCGRMALEPNADILYMRGTGDSDKQIQFTLGAGTQEIVASDDLVIGATGGDLTLYTTTSGDVDLNPASGRIGLFNNGDERAGFDVATAGTLKIYTGANFGALNSTFSGNSLTVANTINAGNKIEIGADWAVEYDISGNLLFSTGGVNKMKLDSSGNLTVTGDITAFGTI